MGAVALLAFAVSTAHYGMNWALMVANNTFNQLLLETTANAEASDGEIPIILVPSAAVSAYYQAIRLAAALLYTPVINYILCNLVLIWRAWALWNRSRWLIAVATFFVISTTTATMISAQTVHRDYSGEYTGINSDPVEAEEMYGLWFVWALSLSTMVFATGMIRYKTWRYRASIKAHLKDGTVLEKMTAKLALNIESGLFLWFIWVIYIASQANPTVYNSNLTVALSPTQSVAIFASVMPVVLAQISGIYPTVVIILVLLRKTVVDMSAPELKTSTKHPSFANRGTSAGSSALSRVMGIGSTQLATQHSIPLADMPRSPAEEKVRRDGVLSHGFDVEYGDFGLENGLRDMKGEDRSVESV